MSLTIGRREDHEVAGIGTPTARAMVLVALAAGLAAGFLAGQADALPAADPDLTRLLRAMAALKLLFVASATAAMVWRMQASIALPQLALYGLTTFAMAAGPGLIWTMSHVVLGAALLHIGLFAALLLLWRDPAVNRLLAAALARRRLQPVGQHRERHPPHR